jgi:cell division protein FtsB
MEQELLIIRLVIMLHDGKETRLDEKKYRREIAKLEAEKHMKEELINNFGAFVQDLET